MLRSWISNKKESLTANASSRSLDKLTEIHDLEEALEAANLIFNDDLDGAEAGLARGQSSFHLLGRALILFLRASLGFEADVMQQAADALSEAEASSAKDLRKAQKVYSGQGSEVYYAGAEYALCNAMCQLMFAIVAVFRESLVESMRGFWKLNAAYKTLQKIVESENAFSDRHIIKAARTTPNTPLKQNFHGEIKSAPASPLHSQMQNLHIDSVLDQPDTHDEDEDEEEFYDADEDQSKNKLDSYTGALEVNGVVEHTGLHSPHDSSLLDHLESPVDEFIHAGTNLCFGMLSLILSLVPPALSKVLGLVGYKGDRRRGLSMLWASSQNRNAMGALAGLMLLAYNNGMVGGMDIVPLADPFGSSQSEDDFDGYPAKLLEILLSEMRQRFPGSKIWAIEQARMLGVQRKLTESLNILKGDFESPLKQVQALAVFERSLLALYNHDYDLCTRSFLECCQKNNWSHALYMYIAGVAQVELYRLAKVRGDDEAARKAASEATKLLQEAKDKTGRRKAFGRQLPFDTFVLHKLTKWEARSARRSVPLIDAIGVSPSEEMIYMWNGFIKMPASHLETSLVRILWSEQAETSGWTQEENDEKALLCFLQSVVLRSLGRYQAAKDLLQNNVLCIEKDQIKGGNKEDWILPAAHYEMAVILWETCYRDGTGNTNEVWTGQRKRSPSGDGEHGAVNKKSMKEAEEWLEKAAGWDAFILDARLGLRVNAGLDTIRAWRRKWDAS